MKLKTKKIKGTKKKGVSYWKKKCWNLFSELVRKSGSFANGNNSCITCGAIKPWKELQAGHFIPGRHNSVLFDFRNCHPQCYRCNVLLKGNPVEYYEYMLDNYGKKVIKELKELDKELCPFKVYELEIKYDSLKNLKEPLI